MRFIKSEQQLQVLNYLNVTNKRITYIIHDILKKMRSSYNSFEGILFLEEGDLLREINLLGINSNTGGIIGIGFIKVELIEAHYFAVYLYNNKIVYLIINKSYCDDEIQYLLDLYL